MKQTTVWIGFLLLLFAYPSLIDNRRSVEFAEIKFQDLEPSHLWDESEDERTEERGVWLNLEGIYALDRNIVFVHGKISGGIFGRSTLLRSADGGRTWREVMTPLRGNSVLHIAFIEDGLGWALVGWTVEGMGPLTLYQSADYGRTWKQLLNMPNDRGAPYGMMFSDEQNGEIKMLYFITNPYTDRLAVLTTSDGGLTWVETNRFLLWEEWDGVATPVATVSVTNKDEVRSQFLALADWSRPEDGFGCWEQCETVGRDGSRWRLRSGGYQEDHAISRRLSTETKWTAIIAVSSQYDYSGGKVVPPER